MKRCAACGQENDEWRPFCTKCGASYSGPAAEPVIGGPPPPDAPPPPPIPPAPGQGAPEPAKSKKALSPALVAAAGVAVVAAIVIAAFVLLANSNSSNSASSTAPSSTTIAFPAKWDPHVADLTRFVESERELDFKHPVKVTFLSKAAFKKRVTTDDSKLTAKDRRELQSALEFLRALGMVEGKVDLFAKLNQLSGESTLAFYDPEKKEIVIPGSELDVAQRITLSHELTHALDDQYFDLQKLDEVADKYDTDAVDALVEGDAQFVEARYRAKLSAADRRAYAASQDDETGPDLEGIPKIFELIQQWPYDFGPQLVSILNDQGGADRINKAFREPPLNEEQVIDPLTFVNDDAAGKIDVPTLPKGAKQLDSGLEFGVLGWYFMLSERIDPHIALKASLGWGADAFITAREGDRTCVTVHYRGENRSDNNEMLSALRLWVAALPKGMASVKATADNTLTLHSCDPGEAAKTVTDKSVDAYQLLVFRNQMIQEFVKAGATVAVSTCVADGVADQTSVAGIAAGTPPPILSNEQAITELAGQCRATSGTVVATDNIDE